MYKNLTKEEAEQKEKELIAQFNTTDPRYGYNVAEGGSDTAKRHRKVVCINTGEVFLTAKEAGIKYNVDVYNACRENGKTAGTHPITKERLIWQYYDEWLIKPKEHKIIKRIKDIKKEERMRKCICIETHKTYDNLQLASIDTNTSVHYILKVCNGEKEKVNELHWAYYEDYIKDPNKYDKMIEKNDNRLRKVICINTGEVFDSISDASSKYNVRIDQACKGACKTAGVHPVTKEKLIWQYYDEWLIEPKQYTKMVKKKDIKKEKKKYICVETGVIYNSVKEAANSINVNCSGISKVCRGEQKTAGGYHWKYIND